MPGLRFTTLPGCEVPSLKYYDKTNDRLVFVEQQATHGFWEKRWSRFDLKNVILAAARNRFVSHVTGRYLPKGSAVLEGGCGIGQYVYCLKENGYEGVGIDFARETLHKAKNAVPRLRLVVGDVKNLPFPDNAFDGYWSMGVIEHFYNGYEDVAMEMKRVLKKGGYLFLTFPSLSKLRRRKIDLQRYADWTPTREKVAGFYQYALSSQEVWRIFSRLGFDSVYRRPICGLIGLQEETDNDRLRRLLGRLYDANSLPGQLLKFYVEHGLRY